LSDKASVLSEIAFGEFDHQTFTVDLERFLLHYEFNDYLKVSLAVQQAGTFDGVLTAEPRTCARARFSSEIM
jgi:hypothetical protein